MGRSGSFLLLNAVLTVPYGNANGHQGKGWEIVTDAAIKALSDRGKVVFILWEDLLKIKFR